MGNIKTKTKIRVDDSGHTTTEEESRNADGSSDYQKEVRMDDYSTVYFFNSEKAADGTESYSETTYNADDSRITKTKDSDGTYSETKYDANRDNVSRVRTLPDGIVAVTTWEIGMNGEEKSERTHYSNGDEYIYNFEYNENGRIVKGSGTRNRAGIQNDSFLSTIR